MIEEKATNTNTNIMILNPGKKTIINANQLIILNCFLFCSLHVQWVKTNISSCNGSGFHQKQPLLRNWLSVLYLFYLRLIYSLQFNLILYFVSQPAFPSTPVDLPKKCKSGVCRLPPARWRTCQGYQDVDRHLQVHVPVLFTDCVSP